MAAQSLRGRAGAGLIQFPAEGNHIARVTRSGRSLVLVLKAAVSTGLVVYLIRGVGLSEAANQVRQLSASTSVTVVALMLAYTLVAAARWMVVLRAMGSHPGLRGPARATFIAAFFNQFLPTTVGGDAMRIWESTRSGFALPVAVSSVVLERAGYLASLSLIAAAMLAAWDGDRLPPGVVSTFWALFAASVAGSMALQRLDRIPARFVPAVVRGGTDRFAADCRRVFASPGRLAAILLSAAASQAVLSLAVFLLARNYGASLSFIDCLALMPAVVLVSSLPVSVAGWGVREVAMVTAFGFAGVPAAVALVTSISLALFSILASLPGGLFWLTKRRDSPTPEDAQR